MQQPRVHFIGGEKGGVGKSVVARLLAQYWIDKEIPWQGFDTDRSHGALLRYYADFSQPVEINEIDQLDRIVESTLERETNTLVDLAAQTESQLQRWMDDSDLAGMGEEFGLGITLWYVLEDGKDSLNLLQAFLQRHQPGADYVIVLNQGRGGDFNLYRDSELAKQVAELAIPVMELKALHRPTMRKIDQYDKSFWAAVNNSDPALGECLGLMERQRVKNWLKQAYQAFDTLGV